MEKVLSLLNYLEEEGVRNGSICFNGELMGHMREAVYELKDYTPSPVPTDFIEIG